MKRIALAAGLGVAFFLAGLVGTYYALPHVAPSYVPDVAPADSQRAALSDSLRGLPRASADSTLNDSIRSTDSTRTMATLEDSLGLSPDQANRLAIVQQLRDSISVLNDSLTTLSGDYQSTTEARDALQAQVEALESTQATAADVGNTLTKLEDAELRAVLDQLDMQMYEMLYSELSGRNRARLLQSLPPEKAANLVDRMISQTGN